MITQEVNGNGTGVLQFQVSEGLGDVEAQSIRVGFTTTLAATVSLAVLIFDQQTAVAVWESVISAAATGALDSALVAAPGIGPNVPTAGAADSWTLPIPRMLRGGDQVIIQLAVSTGAGEILSGTLRFTEG